MIRRTYPQGEAYEGRGGVRTQKPTEKTPPKDVKSLVEGTELAVLKCRDI